MSFFAQLYQREAPQTREMGEPDPVSSVCGFFLVGVRLRPDRLRRELSL